MTEDARQIDEQLIRDALVSMVPFNGHVGVEVLEAKPGRGVVRLPDSEQLRNHVGTQHAGALFLAGEAAGGAAFVGSFAAEMGEITFLMRHAEVDYHQLARGPITATCEFGDELARVRRELAEEGRSTANVTASLTDGEGRKVCSVTLRYHVKRQPD
ncbi:MAG: DUF4442 domain-containing protein [Solirubrobacterales bacterium]|nr:DUF4442 domain-containing protein [Solirubrobacterales bacterium]